jgi:hypothetical protein
MMKMKIKWLLVKINWLIMGIIFQIKKIIKIRKSMKMIKPKMNSNRKLKIQMINKMKIKARN